MSYADKLKDPRWQKCRLETLERAAWKCANCSNENNTLHVHHLYYLKGKQPWECEPGQLVVLCVPCHKDAEVAREGILRHFASLPVHCLISFDMDLDRAFEDPGINPREMMIALREVMECSRTVKSTFKRRINRGVKRA